MCKDASSGSSKYDELSDRAAKAASVALQEEKESGKEGPGATAARRAALAGAAAASVGFEVLGAVQDYARILRTLVKLPAKAGHLFRKYAVQQPRGVLLWGPPGTGKTCLACAAASDAGQPLFLLNGPDLLSEFYGESEAGIRGVFAAARACGPSIIFIDELDALAPSRGNGRGGSGATPSSGESSARIVSTLLEEMDGLSSHVGNEGFVVVLATTNRPEAIDSALRRPGRFDREIEVGAPSPAGRAEILRRKLQGMHHCLATAEINDLARITHGFVGADLSALCQEAALVALHRFILDRPVGSTAIHALATAADFRAALTRVHPSALREMAIQIPKVRWEDIGGYEIVKQRLQEAVVSQLQRAANPQTLSLKGVKGVLLFGPPGCSKTLLVRAVATEAGLNFISVKASDLLSKYVGESEKAVAALFARARQAAPAIVFIDELDGLAMARNMHGSVNETNSSILSQLLTEMDGLQAMKDVLVVAATNRPDHLDPALLRPGRFDRLVYVPCPDAGTRLAILEVVCRRAPLAPDVNLADLADKLEGYTGADLQGLYTEAALQALRDDRQASLVAACHFKSACQIVHPTGNLSAADVAMFQKFGTVNASCPGP
eukprot:jgi/Botrbrau1/9066/Bobra.0376s0036.1